jgi:hypothetical protein
LAMPETVHGGLGQIAGESPSNGSRRGDSTGIACRLSIHRDPQGGRHRRLHWRHGGAEGFAERVAAGLSGSGDGAAYAGGVHAAILGALEFAMPDPCSGG